ncbi:MAG: hypothetical protein ACOC7R_00705 [Planctomycetota bacterium]
MKSKRRHELKESELAKELNKAGVLVKEHLGTVVLSILAAGAVVFLVVTLVGRTARAREAEWFDLAKTGFHRHGEPAERLAVLQSLAEQSSQDVVAAWAHVRAGELALQIVADGWYELSEAERSARLQEARTAFEAVVADYDDHVRAVGKAQLGLGRVAEYQGDDEAAIAHYTAAAALEPRGGRLIAAEALARRARLATLPEAVSLATRPATQPAEGAAPTQPAP